MREIKQDIHCFWLSGKRPQILSMQDDTKRMDALVELERMQIAFEDSHQYLLKLLTTKSLKIGDKSGIQSLVTMLNFNRFYRWICHHGHYICKDVGTRHCDIVLQHGSQHLKLMRLWSLDCSFNADESGLEGSCGDSAMAPVTILKSSGVKTPL